MSTTEWHSGTVLADLAGRSLRALPALADDLVDRMWEQVYDPAGPVPKDDFRRSCQDNIAGVLTMVRGGTRPELLASARETGTRRAQQHCPLEWVLQAWQAGGELVWDDLAGRAGGGDELRELVRYAGDVWAVANRFSVEMAATYQRVDQHLRAGTDRYLVDILDALLDGHAGELGTEAVRALRLTGDPRFVVAVAEDAPLYHGSARALAHALDGHGLFSVWRLRAGVHVGLIAAGQADSEAVAAILRLPTAGRLGLSPVLTDLARVPTGYRMASLAMQALTPGDPAVTIVDDCLPQALLLDSPELCERLVTSTLGPILALPTGERDDLLRTMHAWIDALGSAHKTAKTLYCHRNTVLNRLRRIQTLTGLDLADAGSWPRAMLGLTAYQVALPST